uniref:Uncharacterized protein n=1 Tax=Arundo donax TaxID=35708 RepID=A0A0A8YXA6_ARUDO
MEDTAAAITIAKNNGSSVESSFTTHASIEHGCYGTRTTLCSYTYPLPPSHEVINNFLC